MLDVPPHDGRRIALGAGQEHGRAGHARDFLFGNPGHEFRHWNQRFAHPHSDSGGASMPDPHYTIHRDSQDQGHISALGYLGEIREEESSIYYKQKSHNPPSPPPHPTPHL